MHALVDAAHVDHLHPDAGIAIAAAADGEALTKDIFLEQGPRSTAIPVARQVRTDYILDSLALAYRRTVRAAQNCPDAASMSCTSSAAAPGTNCCVT